MATYRESITALVANLKTIFGNTTMTEAQAIAASSAKPNTIFFTSDTHCIVLGGTVYGRGQQLGSVFRLCPAGEQPGTGDFMDTSVIYVQPESGTTNFTLWWYSPSNTWAQTGSYAFDIPMNAKDIGYDLTNTPDLGEGDVQSAIEAVDADIDTKIIKMIKDRMPWYSSVALTGGPLAMTKITINGSTGVIVTSTDGARTTYWTLHPVKKGTLIYLNIVRSSNGTVQMGYCVDNPSDYYADNSNTLAGMELDEIIYNGASTRNHNVYYVMPEDAYVLWSYTTTNVTEASIEWYDPNLLVSETKRRDMLVDLLPKVGITAYAGSAQQNNVVLNATQKKVLAQSASGWGTIWSINKIPKGTLIHLTCTYSTAHTIIYGIASNSPQDYYVNNGTLLNFEYDDSLYYRTAKENDMWMEMPYDAYILYSRCTSNVTKALSIEYYPMDVIKTAYDNGFSDGAGMASIAGLGYNIYDYITGRANLDGFKYGCYIRRTYDGGTFSMSSWLSGNTSIVYMPDISYNNCSSVTLYYTFNGCTNLVTLPDSMSIPYRNTNVSAHHAFSGCSKLKRIPTLGEVKLSTMQYFASSCAALTHVADLSANSATVTNFQYAFSSCTSLLRIECLDFTSASGDWAYNANYNMFRAGGGSCSVRYMLIKNFGTASGFTGFNSKYATAWGVANDAVPDARQSLVDTLLTYSFDRATAEYDNCTVTLSAATLAVLTEEEKTAITAKGYILTS